MMFLPSYSPDLNPIEQLFAKLKAVIRRLAPRSREALFEVIGYALHQVSSAECANYLAHGGYGRSAENALRALNCRSFSWRVIFTCILGRTQMGRGILVLATHSHLRHSPKRSSSIMQAMRLFIDTPTRIAS